MNELSNPNQGSMEILEQSSLVTEDDFDDIGAGIRSGFPVISYKQSKWRVRWMGQEVVLTDNGHPVPEIGVSLIKVPDYTVKKYYAVYEKDSRRPPDCWSNDGIRPDPSLIPPQQPDGRAVPTLCCNCYFDAIGSRMFGTKRLKACGDFKRVVVKIYYPVLPGDLANLAMLMPVPPGSLQNLKLYGEFLKSHKAHAIARVTYIGFDPNETDHPKLTFRHGPALSDDEYLVVKNIRNSSITTQIINAPPTFENGEVADEEDIVTPAPQAQAPQTRQINSQLSVVKPQVNTGQLNPQTKPVSTANLQPQAGRVNSQQTQVAAKPTQTPVQPRQAGQVGVQPGPAKIPSTPTARPVTPPPGARQGGTIARAVSTPAAPPPSARTVVHPETVQKQNVETGVNNGDESKEPSSSQILNGMMDKFGQLGLGE